MIKGAPLLSEVAYLACSLECPADGKGGAERIEAHVFMFRFGKAAVGDVLVKSAEVDRKALRDRDPMPAPMVKLKQKSCPWDSGAPVALVNMKPTRLS